jgi:cell filamentation protein
VRSGFTHDPHSEQGYACPRNLFGITDYLELQAYEAPLAAKRGGELEDRGVGGDFDPRHLKAIHRYLFQDVFPWAGEFRLVNISKGSSTFGPAIHIEAALADALAKLKGESLLVGLTAHGFAVRAAFYLGEINAIHPFREGNGRTQREFVRQLALRAKHPLSWAGFTQEQMTDASILSHTKGDSSQLAAILEAALDSTRESKTEG